MAMMASMWPFKKGDTTEEKEFEHYARKCTIEKFIKKGISGWWNDYKKTLPTDHDELLSVLARDISKTGKSMEEVAKKRIDEARKAELEGKSAWEIRKLKIQHGFQDFTKSKEGVSWQAAFMHLIIRHSTKESYHENVACMIEVDQMQRMTAGEEKRKAMIDILKHYLWPQHDSLVNLPATQFTAIYKVANMKKADGEPNPKEFWFTTTKLNDKGETVHQVVDGEAWNGVQKEVIGNIQRMFSGLTRSTEDLTKFIEDYKGEEALKSIFGGCDAYAKSECALNAAKLEHCPHILETFGSNVKKEEIAEKMPDAEEDKLKFAFTSSANAAKFVSTLYEAKKEYRDHITDLRALLDYTYIGGCNKSGGCKGKTVTRSTGKLGIIAYGVDPNDKDAAYQFGPTNQHRNSYLHSFKSCKDTKMPGRKSSCSPPPANDWDSLQYWVTRPTNDFIDLYTGKQKDPEEEIARATRGFIGHANAQVRVCFGFDSKRGVDNDISLLTGTTSAEDAHSDYYNELNRVELGTFDSFHFQHHDDTHLDHSLSFDDRNHYQPLNDEYIEVSGSGSPMLIGGVVG
eukprot:887726_1